MPGCSSQLAVAAGIASPPMPPDATPALPVTSPFEARRGDHPGCGAWSGKVIVSPSTALLKVKRFPVGTTRGTWISDSASAVGALNRRPRRMRF
jgi:hypothetical protein